jgi:hypothetical protein
MNDQRKTTELDKCNETPVREPLFGRYRIKIKTGLRVGAVPTGGWPEGF